MNGNKKFSFLFLSAYCTFFSLLSLYCKIISTLHTNIPSRHSNTIDKYHSTTMSFICFCCCYLLLQCDMSSIWDISFAFFWVTQILTLLSSIVNKANLWIFFSFSVEFNVVVVVVVIFIKFCEYIEKSCNFFFFFLWFQVEIYTITFPSFVKRYLFKFFGWSHFLKNKINTPI